MQIFDNPEFRRRILEHITPPRRDDGKIHVSDLLYCLRKAYYEKTDPLPPTDKQKMYFARGLGLQVVLWGDDEPPGECEGISYSIDRLNEGMVEELKTTNLKSFKPTDSWLHQVKAYCYCTGTTKCNFGVFSLSITEIYGKTLVFTSEEIQETWTMILSHRDILDAALKNSILPAGVMDMKEEKWQCKECAYRLRCSA